MDQPSFIPLYALFAPIEYPLRAVLTRKVVTPPYLIARPYKLIPSSIPPPVSGPLQLASDKASKDPENAEVAEVVICGHDHEHRDYRKTDAEADFLRLFR